MVPTLGSVIDSLCLKVRTLWSSIELNMFTRHVTCVSLESSHVDLAEHNIVTR